jgi:signal transduction histidine kinase
MVFNANGEGFALPADQNLFIARKVLEIGTGAGLLDKNADLLRRDSLQRLIEVEEHSIALAQQFPTADLFDGWEADKLQPLKLADSIFYGVIHRSSRGNCVFETDIPEQLPDSRAGHDAMVTGLVNLLDNAYKYSNDEKRIKLSVTSADGKVCFRVSDNGLGIPRRALKKVFRRFYQVDRSLSRRTEGCGLGLSIAKFIVDAHQGNISVESKPNQGSTFTVTIPTAPSA